MKPILTLTLNVPEIRGIMKPQCENKCTETQFEEFVMQVVEHQPRIVKRFVDAAIFDAVVLDGLSAFSLTFVREDIYGGYQLVISENDIPTHTGSTFLDYLKERGVPFHTDIYIDELNAIETGLLCSIYKTGFRTMLGEAGEFDTIEVTRLVIKDTFASVRLAHVRKCSIDR